MSDKLKLIIKNNGLFYLLGLLIIGGVKLFYSKADGESLDWILAPTACWVEFLSGLSFEKVFNEGFVNHQYRVIIAPACSGINFLIIVYATLLFSFTKRVNKKYLWMVASFIISYISTICVNSIRIIISIYLKNVSIYSGFITSERVHRLEGMLVYLSALFIIYKIAGSLIALLQRRGIMGNEINKNSDGTYPGITKWVPPLFWYFVLTIGIPIVNPFNRNSIKITEHLITVALFLVVITGIFYISFFFKSRRTGR